MFWSKKKPTSITVVKKENKGSKPAKDDYRDFIDDSNLDDDDDDDPLMGVAERIEIIVKDSQLRGRDIERYLKDVIGLIPTISELKQEIKALKAELHEEKLYNRNLIDKLIDRPSAPTGAAAYLASKAAEKAASSSNSTAGPKGKLP